MSGPAHLLLHGERVALNAIAECSAVATAAHDAMQIARKGGWKGCLAATRKTAPGLRLVQKYGILVGGMDTHRMDLSAMVMIKDNHIMAAGGIDKAVRDVHRVAGFSCKIDVECSNVGDALEACQAGADIVMLDNFEASIVEEAAAEIKKKWPNVLVEVSGGITAETLPKFTSPLVDVISFSINRYARPVDMSLKIDP